MSRSDVRYFDATHTYTVGDRAIAHVTGVLKAAGVINDYWFTEIGRQRGSAVHMAAALLDQGRLDGSSVDPRIRGYLEGYLDFKARYRPDWTHVEEIVYSPTYNYAGRVDRAGYLNGTDRLWVVDLKTGAPQRWVRLQLVAYAQALREETGEHYARASLELKADGRFTLTPYDNEPHRYRYDLAAFTGAMALLRWLKREENMT